MTEQKANPQTVNSTPQIPEVRLQVAAESLPYFTTVLQYGIELETVIGTPLSSFLGSLPGLSPDYLAETVQTIFHNGTAVDSLEQPLGGKHPVIALSAAMPGLAGAIFRRNGPHATLRTRTSVDTGGVGKGPLQVTLKLFNKIAKDKGEQLLQSGVVIGCAALKNFLEKRQDLTPCIVGTTFDSVPIPPSQLTRLLEKYTYIHLQVSLANSGESTA